MPWEREAHLYSKHWYKGSDGYNRFDYLVGTLSTSYRVLWLSWINKHLEEITRALASWELTQTYYGTHSHTHSSDIINEAPLMVLEHPELHSSTHRLRAKTLAGPGCACVSLVSTVGFFQSRVVRIKCQGSDMCWESDDFVVRWRSNPWEAWFCASGFHCSVGVQVPHGD